jgi:hypothetical protein
MKKILLSALAAGTLMALSTVPSSAACCWHHSWHRSCCRIAPLRLPPPPRIVVRGWCFHGAIF